MSQQNKATVNPGEQQKETLPCQQQHRQNREHLIFVEAGRSMVLETEVSKKTNMTYWMRVWFKKKNYTHTHIKSRKDRKKKGTPAIAEWKEGEGEAV